MPEDILNSHAARRCQPSRLAGSFAQDFGRELSADAPLYGVIIIYIAMAAAFWVSVGGEQAAFLSYIHGFGGTVAWITLLYLVLGAGVPVLVCLSSTPIRIFKMRFNRLCSARLLASLFMYAALLLFMGAFSTVKPLFPLLQPYRYDVLLADLDAALHLKKDPWLWLQPILGHALVTRAIEMLYYPAWTSILGVGPFAVSVFVRSRELRFQVLMTFLLAWVVFGTALAVAVMSGGPAFYGLLTGDSTRYAGMVSYLANPEQRYLTPRIQSYLWEGYLEGRTGFGYGISAFPSMHVSMSVLWTLAARRMNLAVGFIATLLTAAICLGSVHLGWHYAIEIYFILLTFGLLWGVSGKLGRCRRVRALSDLTGPRAAP